MFQREQPQTYKRVPLSEEAEADSISRAVREVSHCRIRKLVFSVCIAASVLSVASFGTQFFAPQEAKGRPIDDRSSLFPFRARHSPNEDPDLSEWSSPRVAWLMSFPNSGTSFTMRMVGRVTNLTTATNYGKECVESVEETGMNVPVYNDSQGGPFLLSPFTREVPSKYIMTKTHCGSRCTSCGPKTYVESEESFMDMCLTGGHYVDNGTNGKKEAKFVNSKYDHKLVQRAIHLLRDPFDNLVSRFHLQQHEKTKSNSTDWLTKYPNTADGFQTWCSYLDKSRIREVLETDLLDDVTKELMKKVPCMGDFFRYTQWHNLALKVAKDLNVPTLVVHYENYEKNYEGTVSTILEFMELPQNNDFTKFIAGKRYKTVFFSEKQRIAALDLVRHLADEETWSLLERYNSIS